MVLFVGWLDAPLLRTIYHQATRSRLFSISRHWMTKQTTPYLQVGESSFRDSGSVRGCCRHRWQLLPAQSVERIFQATDVDEYLNSIIYAGHLLTSGKRHQVPTSVEIRQLNNNSKHP